MFVPDSVIELVEASRAATTNVHSRRTRERRLSVLTAIDLPHVTALREELGQLPDLEDRFDLDGDAKGQTANAHRGASVLLAEHLDE